MHILTKLNLDNDLDLMLAHKRSMQVAEFAGIGLVHQTSFATAVSEVSRLMLEKGTKPCILLGLKKTSSGRNALCAKIVDEFVKSVDPSNPNIAYARKLLNSVDVEGNTISLVCEIPATLRITREVIARGQKMFEELPPVTPYEEAKLLNVQLQEMAERVVASEKRYQSMTDTLPLIMFTVDQRGELLFANKGFVDLSGFGFGIPDRLDWIKWLTERATNLSETLIREKLAAKEAFTLDALMEARENSEKIWHLLSMTPIETPEAAEYSWSGFLVNIHAQKVVEQTLRHNEELRLTKLDLEKRQQELDSTISNLNRSNQELARFAYVASHDLQEPARKMIVFSDLLLRNFGRLLPDEGNNILSRIKAASERMVEIIRDLLDYSSLSANQRLETHEVSFSDILGVVRDNLENQIAASNGQLWLDGTAVVVGNKRLLVLLFQNLVNNAIKFRREGVAPVVQVKIGPILPGDNPLVNLDTAVQWIRIEVADNGIGFDERFMEKIFQMFQRLHTQDHYKGTGIGLSVCKRIVEMHHGHITARSVPSEGSVFTVYLPLTQSV